MNYSLEWLTHTELVERMEEAVLADAEVPLEFVFELSSDGNTDLFLKNDYAFTKDDIERMIELGWFSFDTLEAFVDDPDMDVFEYQEDTIAQPHQLFQFVLEETFGGGTKVAGIEEQEDCVMLNIAVPVFEE